MRCEARKSKKKKKELPQALYDCKLMFINAAIVCCWKRHQEGTSLRRRHFFLSLLGIKTQILLCHTATVPYLWLMLKKVELQARSLRRKEKRGLTIGVQPITHRWSYHTCSESKGALCAYVCTPILQKTILFILTTDSFLLHSQKD